MNKYLEKDFWPILVEFLRKTHKIGQHLDWMTREFSDEFIKDFTNVYPDLIVQSSNIVGGKFSHSNYF